jgi:hypothetical protein
MTNPKISVLDRIEQSFEIFRKNFIKLFLPIFLYKLLSVVLFWWIATYYFISNIWKLSDNTLDFFTILNDPYIITSIVIWVFLFIVYLLLYIPVLLSIIKSTKQSYNWEKINIQENLLYWFSRFSKSMKTYWYIFVYVALLPAIIFIIWWGLFNAWFYFPDFSIWKQIGWVIMVFSWILFLVFSLYRWIKTTFSISSAIDKDKFTKENFLHSLHITKNNWWRIFWNFFFVWFIVWLVWSFLSWAVWIFIPSAFDFEEIKSVEDLKNIWEVFSIFPLLLSNFVKSIIDTAGLVFIIIFTYIFFKRLEQENAPVPTQDIDNWNANHKEEL